MRALITGIEGFCGKHLAGLLQRQGVRVFGIEHSREDRQVDQSGSVRVEDVQRGDIRDEGFVFRCVRQFQPDRIYHLAGVTVEPDHWEAIQELHATNINGTLNLLEAAKAHGPGDAIVLIASSSAVYAPPSPNDLPLKETACLSTRNHYGLTKLAQEALGQIYFRKHGLRVVIVRPFNIVGPGQSAAFVSSSLAKQIAEAELGLVPPHIAVGNLEPQRDYLDVRDAIRAFLLAIEKGQPGEVYNVCSGCGHSVREILDGLLRHSTLEPSRIQVEQPVERLRTADEVMFHFGDYSKLKSITGWRPEISLGQTLADLLHGWRQALRGR